MRKVVAIVSWSAAKCIDSFPCPLLLSLPLDNGVVARKIGHPLFYSAMWSQIPCGLFSSIEYHFFSEPEPVNGHSPVPNFFAYIETALAFAKHYLSLSFVPQEMSLNIDINKIIPVKFSGVSPNLLSRSVRENVPLEFSRFCTDSIIVSVALRSCDPFCPFLPRFVGIWMLMDLSKRQHRIWKDVDFRELKIDECFVTN